MRGPGGVERAQGVHGERPIGPALAFLGPVKSRQVHHHIGVRRANRMADGGRVLHVDLASAGADQLMASLGGHRRKVGADLAPTAENEQAHEWS